MLRAAALTLLVAALLAGPLEAQRAGATFSAHAAGLPFHSGPAGPGRFPNGFVPRHGFPNGFFPSRGFFPNRFHFRHDGFGAFVIPYFFPDYEAFGYEQPYAEATSEPAPVVVVQQPEEWQSRAPETPPAKPQVIEIPGVGSSPAAKKLPPTIFILTDGERLETRRFVLTASNLSVSVNRHERNIPVDMLDLDATMAANRERGIDLRVPADRNEIFLSF